MAGRIGFWILRVAWLVILGLVIFGRRIPVGVQASLMLLVLLTLLVAFVKFAVKVLIRKRASRVVNLEQLEKEPLVVVKDQSLCATVENCCPMEDMSDPESALDLALDPFGSLPTDSMSMGMDSTDENSRSNGDGFEW